MWFDKVIPLMVTSLAFTIHKRILYLFWIKDRHQYVKVMCEEIETESCDLDLANDRVGILSPLDSWPLFGCIDSQMYVEKFVSSF